MTMNAALFSSEKDDWATPVLLFRQLDEQFRFTVDVCATADNAKCERFYTKSEDGLAQDWSAETCWMNPPYGKGIRAWVEKAQASAAKGATVVGLLPARTDTAWWHDNVQGKADVTFLRGRINFGGGTSNAPFPSVVAVWKPRKLEE